MNLKEERKQKIIDFMKEGPYKPLLFEELAAVLEVPRSDHGKFEAVLGELEKEGRIVRTVKGRYGIPERMGFIIGRLQCNERGYGFVLPDGRQGEDVFIPADSMNGALHNDRVIAKIEKKVPKGKKVEGEIIRVLERANGKVVGTFDRNRHFGFVIPDDKRISGDIFIPKNETGGAKSGQKVVAEIVSWPERRRNAEGRVVEILGNQDEPGVNILAILKSYGIEQAFPDDVMRQAACIPDSVTPDMTEGRRDLRKLRMVTIDSEDAKDLDDAVSVERLPGGNFRLGVHIADVSSYVPEGTPLDKEALKRGTSVYPVDRVVPMLPEKLSNGVCSLNPRVDRLALSVLMDIDRKGNVYSYEIFESIINIEERMTYTDVARILTDKDKELLEKYKNLVDDFILMEKLSGILRNKRVMRGSIDFDLYEAKIKLDEEGRPIDVRRRERTVADRIIEELMLVCNETVAEHFLLANVPFIYRIHEEPDESKLETFSDFISNFGYSLKGVKKVHPKTLQKILENVKGKKEEGVISKVMLRSLMKARYSHQCAGHFGLAVKYYCHFTSPIRRYPDLMIHRIIKEWLHNGIGAKRQNRLAKMVPGIAKSCSESERIAEEAERAAEDLKKVEFMKGREGQIFEGIISGIVSYGMFVELENTIEGFIHLEDMEDDFYVFDEKHLCLTGERRKKVYRIGDTVKVMLTRADVEARKISFVFADEPEAVKSSSQTRISKRKKKSAYGRRHSRFSPYSQG